MAGKRGINYGRFMERAMRGVVSDVLADVARHGLPGEHHFYINFDTTHPGVDIPAYLHERYPREMTIVLQDWYEDLAVTGDRFRVTLNFSNRPETLVVPLDAVKTFVDPSVKFGLKFDDHDEAEAELGPLPAAMAEAGEDDRADDRADDGGDGGGDDGGRDDDGGPGRPGGHPSADVVSLDRFRKR